MPYKCPIKRKESLRKSNKKFKENNPNYFKEYQREYQPEYQREYRLKNKKPPKPSPTQEEVEAKIASQKDYQREYHKNRRKSDHLFNLAHCLRTRTGYAFKVKGYKNIIKTEQLLGADYEIVKNHLENLFTEGMSWDNHGEWEIDHIKPLSSAKSEEELKNLSHYTNLQPLWMNENRKKGGKV